MLTQKVESYRSTAARAIADILEAKPQLGVQLRIVGVDVDTVTTIVLGHLQKESEGIPWVLGDRNDGGKQAPLSDFNAESSRQMLYVYDSIGLMQLDYGKSNPQHDGYTGDKLGLLDPYTNIYYGSLFVISNLIKYKGGIRNAIAAYNAGSARHRANGTFINEQYVDDVWSFIKGYLSPAQVATEEKAAAAAAALPTPAGNPETTSHVVPPPAASAAAGSPEAAKSVRFIPSPAAAAPPPPAERRVPEGVTPVFGAVVSGIVAIILIAVAIAVHGC